MNKITLLLTFNILVLLSCKSKETFKPRNISKVEVETLVKDSLLNVRALEVVKGNVLFGTSKGEIYVYTPSENSINLITFEWMEMDSINPPNYRAIAYVENKVFGLAIESPALLYMNGKLVYKENHPKVFYDSMDFWNDQEGIAIGDPTDACMSIIITRDGGETWNKLPCGSLPKAKEGEAAFAASDTNITIVDDHTWVATGGKASRVLYSPNKGKTWEVFDTPIIQGKETTGMYSIDFYDELNGFAIGGDYTKPNDNVANKIKTVDGGKTWELVAQNEEPSYRSCVQYIPNREGKELIAIGFKGIDYSNDSGNSWKHLNDEGFYTIRFLNDSIAYAAGSGRLARLTFRE
ncbi:WD40/YVTN/BNR-like repeat-containing protein [Flavivirga rizhaonensis]|uniref:Oxidoreductase n=1 Tax=Flavivirga rizhaonensis TaxID=2559571 RepID=A0A4S1DX20_9FLAO|nr:oxidoreductase [Flavivirga rizhaonensis]TGV02690.1 oxidoreductase [Flavivirga rizhaonensis]